MSILVGVRDSSAPLDQGDLLCGLTLVYSQDGEFLAAEETDGLVISRPCVAGRRKLVQVALVRARPMDMGKILSGERDSKGNKTKASFDRVRQRIDAIRDGDGELKDRFYLGARAGDNARIAAFLDEVFLIQVPVGEDRQTWVAKHRKARLKPAFRDDLRARLYNTFCRQGFPEYEWYDDEDLSMLLDHGEASLAQLRSDLATAKSERTAALADGHKNQARGLGTRIPKLENEIAEIEEKLEPFRCEKSARQTS